MATKRDAHHKTEPAPLNRRIGIRLSDDDVAEFARVAAQQERSIGAVIRRSARAGLELAGAIDSAERQRA